MSLGIPSSCVNSASPSTLPTERPILFSVIIPASERVDSLLKTLTKISECQPSADEILVHVDGGSSQVIEAVSKHFPEVRLTHSAIRQGPGGARNALVRAASHEWIANFDDDSFPEDPGYFRRLAETVKRFPHAAIVTARNHNDPPGPFEFEQVSEASGCGCTFNKSWFERVGGFVPLPIAYNMEEVDMGLRIHSEGGVIVKDYGLRVVHDKSPPDDISEELNSAILANTALFPYLRFPSWLMVLGLWHVLHRIVFLFIKGWHRGILDGIRMIPDHLRIHSSLRKTVSTGSLITWLWLRRHPKAIIPSQPVT